jgi:hypothetical protein
MPSKSANLQQHSLGAGAFGFSAVGMEDLEATEYTLVTVVVDKSSSVASYEKEMEACIKEVVESCKSSPRSEFLLIRLVAFNQDMSEIHGFKRLIDCDLSDYDGCLNPGGTTALFATVKNAVDATAAYGQNLVDSDYSVNALVVILTDGMDNRSDYMTPPVHASDVKDAMAEITRSESLESLLSILVGVGVGGYTDISQYLNDFQTESKLDQYVEIKDANAKTLAKLAKFVSRSISSQSSALGTGGPSQPLQF